MVISSGGIVDTEEHEEPLLSGTLVFTTTSVSLVDERQTHLCWDLEGEDGPILLLGGTYGPDSTELVSSDGLSSSPSFNLTYDTE